MDKDQNPLHTIGERNVFCPYYSNCLDYAAKRYWEYWACLDCRYKRKQKLLADVLLPTGNADTYYTVSPSIYKEAKDFSL